MKHPLENSYFEKHKILYFLKNKNKIRKTIYIYIYIYRERERERDFILYLNFFLIYNVYSVNWMIIFLNVKYFFLEMKAQNCLESVYQKLF